MSCFAICTSCKKCLATENFNASSLLYYWSNVAQSSNIKSIAYRINGTALWKWRPSCTSIDLHVHLISRMTFKYLSIFPENTIPIFYTQVSNLWFTILEWIPQNLPKKSIAKQMNELYYLLWRVFVFVMLFSVSLDTIKLIAIRISVGLLDISLLKHPA